MKIKIQIFFLLILLLLLGCSKHEQTHKKVLVLGIDGMDPLILNELIDQGKMQTFKRFIEKGYFKNLYSSIPPQSPVAWSNVITGNDPETHGIFDFIHRHPETLEPYLSGSEIEEPGSFISLGKWRIPLKGGKMNLLRKGESFWRLLENQGIPSTIIKMPSNFPPAESESRTLSGMGTPDLLGTPGEFTFFSNDPKDIKKKDKISGGYIKSINITNNHFKSKITGPDNVLIKENPQTEIEFDVYIDYVSESVRLDIQGNRLILKKDELSEWIEIEFEIIPLLKSIKGICKFMVTQLEPYFKLYVSPINIHPKEPAMPISTPEDYSKELADNIGLFYTQQMAEDTKAFEYDILNMDQYLTQAKYVYDERKKMYRYLLENWESGLLFFYFSSLDLNTHMLWWERDSKSALYKKEIYDKYGDLIGEFYEEMDSVLKETLEKINDDVTVILMSDHGFAPFYKKFNLNNWLEKEGYLGVKWDWKSGVDQYFSNVDWSKTKAYGLGLNALYLNLMGRELTGIVDGFERTDLLQELKEKLLKVKDLDTGEPIIKNVYIMSEIFDDANQMDMPDIIVGYKRGYACSHESAFGEFSNGIIEINTDKWSGDHCMDFTEVPGILITNKKITKDQCFLYDITPTLLKEYNIPIPEDMKGKSLF